MKNEEMLKGISSSDLLAELQRRHIVDANTESSMPKKLLATNLQKAKVWLNELKKKEKSN